MFLHSDSTPLSATVAERLEVLTSDRKEKLTHVTSKRPEVISFCCACAAHFRSRIAEMFRMYAPASGTGRKPHGLETPYLSFQDNS